MIENLLDKILKKRVIINCEHDPYLHRWFLWKGERLGIYIHKFVRSDEDRCLHCHPWSFIVIPIWRGYIEHSESLRQSGEIYEGFHRVYPIIGTRFRKGTFRHRVELFNDLISQITEYLDGSIKGTFKSPLPAWSIFIRFKRFREWGFWPEGKFISWHKWWKENKCE